jgi:nicotinamide mononucleotide (NMN) deamidase PncC
MEQQISTLIREIHSQKSLLPHFKIAATGGGSLFQSIFAQVPGISYSLIGMNYPYAEKETISYLGFRPEKLASEECALELAMKAYQDAAEYGQKTLGIGISCALATERELKGGERAFLAIFGEDKEGKSIACVLKFTFNPEEIRDIFTRRQAEERAIAEVGIYFLLYWLEKKEFSKDCCDDANLELKIFKSSDLQSQILKRSFFSNRAERKENIPESKKELVLFPCTANPPHDGHFKMAHEMNNFISGSYFERRFQVLFNLTFDPPHKPVVEPHEMLLRVKLIQKAGYDCLLSTNDGLFVEKIKKYGMHLMMGFDAFYNFLSKKFYPENYELNLYRTETKDKNILEFYVFDRNVQEISNFDELIKSMENKNWPTELLNFNNSKLDLFLYTQVKRMEFSNLSSSSKIREGKKENE